MIETISLKIINYLTDKKVVDKENSLMFNYYKYGVEISVSSLLNVFLILGLGIIFKSFSESLVFLICFIPLRQFTGGYHADTYLKCNSMFCVGFLLTLMIYYISVKSISFVGFIIVLLFSLLINIFFGPVENENKPFKNIEQYKRCRRISNILFSALCVLALILNYFNIKYGLMILFTLQLIAVLIIIAKFKERRTI